MTYCDNQPSKRPCLSRPDTEFDTPGEAPEEVDFDLPAARAQNDSKLKSLFEGIFAKYSHDFTDVGDEIDLESGDIVVDNGHLLGIREEGESGGQTRSWLFQAGLEQPENPATDHENDTEEEDGDTESVPSPIDHVANATKLPAPSPAPVSDQQADEDDALDFVFTFKASGASGLSPVTKTHQISRPTNPPSSKISDPITASKPQDPIWAVPDLPKAFSTPTTETRKVNAITTPSARSPSPPGSGSVWAVKKLGRPRTESKPKATPRQRKPGTKRKYHSSPVTRDWSFAEVPDGNESDDPLQDYEPSPTPSKVRIVRGQRQVPTKDGRSPSVQAATPSKVRINHEKRRRPHMDTDAQIPQPSVFSPTKLPAKESEADSDGAQEERDQSVLEDDAPEIETQHTEPLGPVSPAAQDLEDEMEVQHNESLSPVFSTAQDPQDEKDETNNEDRPPQPNSPTQNVVEPSIIFSVENETATDDNIDAQVQAPNVQSRVNMASQSILRPESTPIRDKVPRSPQNTPSKRRIMSPDEAKLIMRVMHQENGKASEVVKLMPTLEYHAVWHWYFHHWTHRLTKPPHLSAPWSPSELAIFIRLSNQSGLTWAEIQREFSGRSRSEVEFELLRSFVSQASTEHPGKQPDNPANEDVLDSSQESQDVWMQAEEIKSEQIEDVLPSVEHEHPDARGERVSPVTSESPGEVRHHNQSFVANTLKTLFLR
ncbi:unnamed protein product [Penicillium salamii]|uniref:Myb-like domain-containing protein n=1 Tax=Penicillium salamii TaxID=1612424 RepID=A0A9W4IQS3_9EURO|nr:unnamed protein product [Penicillium salamii]CAG8119548.1 unnamed protein product [Penicillium salamii]CAG8292535.1 unnamed protein product [Penicillium salamii]CAG8344330.1 unnamed protein product [Penicillium salamii]CAG8346203.1 unnamed protein product [Penicillium salamii]